MIDFTTRNQNPLDLILTSHPAFMMLCSLPPLWAKTDHDIVINDTTHEVVRTRQPRRKILLLKNVDRDTTKQARTELSILQACSRCSTLIFHPRPAHHVLLIHGSPQRLVALAAAKPEHNRRLKFSNNIEDRGKYKSLKTESQREMRRAHWSYIRDTVNQDLTSYSKLFTPMSETSGISPQLNKNGFLHSRSTIKAEILNQQFQYVYTKETFRTSLILATVKFHLWNPSPSLLQHHQAS